MMQIDKNQMNADENDTNRHQQSYAEQEGEEITLRECGLTCVDMQLSLLGMVTCDGTPAIRRCLGRNGGDGG